MLYFWYKGFSCSSDYTFLFVFQPRPGVMRISYAGFYCIIFLNIYSYYEILKNKALQTKTIFIEQTLKQGTVCNKSIVAGCPSNQRTNDERRNHDDHLPTSQWSAQLFPTGYTKLESWSRRHELCNPRDRKAWFKPLRCQIYTRINLFNVLLMLFIVRLVQNCDIIFSFAL